MIKSGTMELQRPNQSWLKAIESFRSNHPLPEGSVSIRRSGRTDHPAANRKRTRQRLRPPRRSQKR